MSKITTHLWFDTEAVAAATFYTSIIPDSRIIHSSTLHHTPSGDVDTVLLELAGQEFNFISAGPLFKFNPSISFLIACATAEEVDQLWNKLAPGGSVLMELGEYPFSQRFGWIQDIYGVSWQILHTTAPILQKITPTLMFVGDACGKAEEAINMYVSVFSSKDSNSKIGTILRYAAGEDPDKEGTIKHATFTLADTQFVAMDSAYNHNFSFNEAISFMVHCENQEEIDYYWDALSAVPESEQCGWLKDKFGVSWQIVPTMMDEMMRHGSQEQIARVTEAFLKMKKFDLAELKKAYDSK